MTADELNRSIAATNNGYIFAPTAVEIACAKANHEKFSFSNGAIFKKQDGRTFAPINSRMDARGSYVGEFDCEGAILARQEKLMMDY